METQKQKRSEFETILVQNPTQEDFVARYNGEPYKILAGETKPYPYRIAYHIAKQLSDKILGKEIVELKKKNKTGQPNPALSQLLLYDNAKRRIALYSILGSREEVEECVIAFNYTLRGFIGDFSEYDEYVSSINLEDSKKRGRPTKVSSDTTEQ